MGTLKARVNTDPGVFEVNAYDALDARDDDIKAALAEKLGYTPKAALIEHVRRQIEQFRTTLNGKWTLCVNDTVEFTMPWELRGR